MLEIVGRTLQAAVSLIDVRAKLLLHDAEQAAAALLWKAAAGACLGLAALVGIAAGAIALAPVWGWPAVLGAGAGVLALVGLVAWAVAASVQKPKSDPIAEDLELQAARWRAVLQPPEVKVLTSPPAGASSAPVDDPLKALHQLIKDPMVIASAIFAVTAVLGPMRAIRTAARVAAAASAARQVAKAVRESPLGTRL